MTVKGFNVSVTDGKHVLLEYRDDKRKFDALLTAGAARELASTIQSRADKADPPIPGKRNE